MSGFKMIESKESNYKTMALFFAVSIVLVILYLGLYVVGIVQSVETASSGLIDRSLILNLLLLAFAVYGTLILYGELQGRDIGLVTRKLPLAAVIGLITWILVQIAEAAISQIGTGSVELNGQWSTESLSIIGLLIGMLFGTALYEEIGFRGFFLIQFRIKLKDSFENRYLQVAVALLLSQALFTVLHVPWRVFNDGWTMVVVQELLFSVFLNGIIYGLLYLRTENLFFVMMVHALGNAPTSLVSPIVQPSNLLLLMAIIWAVIWPKLRRWEGNNTILSEVVDSTRK